MTSKQDYMVFISNSINQWVSEGHNPYLTMRSMQSTNTFHSQVHYYPIKSVPEPYLTMTKQVLPFLREDATLNDLVHVDITSVLMFNYYTNTKEYTVDVHPYVGIMDKNGSSIGTNGEPWYDLVFHLNRGKMQIEQRQRNVHNMPVTSSIIYEGNYLEYVDLMDIVGTWINNHLVVPEIPGVPFYNSPEEADQANKLL